MNNSTWSRAHLDWVEEGGLRDFGVKDLGASTAALKILLVLTCLTGEPEPGPPYRPRQTVALTYEGLEDLCDVSRGAIRPALNKLGHLVEVDPGIGRRPSLYQIVFIDGKKWVKLPSGRLLMRSAGGSNVLEEFTPRDRAGLSALKLYWTLLAFRNGTLGETRISYDAINRYSGLGRTDISRGRSLLIGAGLITVFSPRSGDDWETEENRSNRYIILGLSAGNGQKQQPILNTMIGDA